MYLRDVIRLLIRIVYQLILSPILHFFGGPLYGCRFVPTCSQYSSEAFEAHSVPKATILTLQRILKCHPLSRAGYDPVPRDI